MTARFEYGVDLVTFYHPSFWGVSSRDELMELRRRDPALIWSTIFDALVEAGISGIEMTFPPADTSSAIEVFGSPAGCKSELDARVRHVMSRYHTAPNAGPRADIAAAGDRAAARAQCLAEAGGTILVAGPPMRRSRDAQPPMFSDHAFLSSVADTA